MAKAEKGGRKITNRLPEAVTKVYQYMEEHGKEENRDSQIWHIWRGHGLDIAKAVDCSVASVYKAVSLLTLMSCISKIKHSSTTTPGVYRIIKAPVTSEYLDLRERSLTSDRLEVPSHAQRTRDEIGRAHV